jgi:P4 family phage/plasmid primase-like protien
MSDSTEATEHNEDRTYTREELDALMADSSNELTGAVFDPVKLGMVTEAQAAKALAHRIHQRERVVFDAVRDVWLQWGKDANDQPVWQIVPSNALDYARTHVAAVAEAFAGGDPKGDFKAKARAKLRARVGTSAGVGALAKLVLDVARRPGSVLYRRADLIDADDKADQLWAGGWLWYLRTNQNLEPGEAMVPSGHESHNNVHLKTTACAPDINVKTPLWDALLDAIFADDDEARAYFMAVMGVCVTGTSDRVLPILYGPSGRGKSYVMKLILDVMGSYGYAADASLLGENPDRASLAELEGKRLVFVDEGPRAGKLATERLKALTGGTRQTTRANYQKPTSWVPRFTLVLTTNELPPVADPAVRARLRPVDFGDSQADEVAAVANEIGDPETSRVWARERPGVLAQLMIHAGRYLADRSVANAPAWVNEALDDMEREQNPVKAWLEDRTTDGETPSGALYEDFVAWCNRAGIRNPWSLNKWGHEVTTCDYPARHTRTGKVRQRALKPLEGRVGWSPVTPVTPAVTPETAGGSQVNGVVNRQLSHPVTTVTTSSPTNNDIEGVNVYGGKIGNGPSRGHSGHTGPDGGAS